MMEKLSLALDWTPNINHIGFFIAQEKGFFQDLGLAVTITDPSMDNYALTPAKKVELGQADLALCPTESVISYRTKANPFDLLGIATIFQEDLSAIVVKADSAIYSPKDLDGKSYASYHARYEDKIVQQMIRNDGGKGDIQIVYPEKLGIWDTVLNGQVDATWIFTNWEGVEAASGNSPLRYFKMKDFGIPYAYSPMMAGSERKILAREDVFSKFLFACRQGFLFAVQEPDTSVAILRPHLPEKDQQIDLLKALTLSQPAFGQEEGWGRMEEDMVDRFLQWIYDHKLEAYPLKVEDLMTNKLIDTLG
ncbi:MAG: ABC transporter substrate-binding protein [Bacteroidota bacterium]